MVWAALLEVKPQTRTLPTALRVALCLGTALVVLLALGRADLAIYATFGGFTAIHGRLDAGRARLRVQTRHALVLTAAVATGAAVALSDHRAWVAVPVTAAWAALAARLSDLQQWRPPGPLFVVFAVGACSSVALPDLRAAVLATGVTAATAALAVLLGSAGLVLARQAVPGPRAAGVVVHPLRRQRVQAARCAAAVLLAGSAAVAFVPSHPYWAMVAAVAPMAAPTLETQLARAAHRVLGTVVGLGLAAVLLLLPLGVVGTVAAVLALQVSAEVLAPRHYGAAMVAITPLALLVGELAVPQPVGRLLADRGIETLLGVAVGAALVVLTRRRPRS